MLNKTNINKIASRIHGWIYDDERELLYTLAKDCKGSGVIVEIGSWKGKSTIMLGQGSKDGSKITVYAIDPHIGSPEHRERYGEVWTFNEFKNNIKGAKLDDIVIPIVKTSEKANKNFELPVELIFIDGAHDYESVKLDFVLWFPKVIYGGIMAFHDVFEGTGPKKVVEEFLYESKFFRNVKLVHTIAFGEKCGKLHRVIIL